MLLLSIIVGHRNQRNEKNSWCQYNLDKLNGTQNYKPWAGIPLSVIKQIKPIFIPLKDEKLSSECLHRKTQNQIIFGYHMEPRPERHIY